MDNTRPRSAPEHLQAQLDQLEQRGGRGFNPVQFSLIESLLRRAGHQAEPVAQGLYRRVEAQLLEFCDEFNTARTEAEQDLESGRAQFPAEAEALQQCFDSGNFRILRRRLKTLGCNTSPHLLRGLADYIVQEKSTAHKPQALSSFDDMLRQEERELVSAGAQVEASRGELPSAGAQEGIDAELNSMHYLRESLVRRNADQLVTRALRDIPEGAGPLNPEKLIVQSLSSMRDLSPHYLNRFVASIDTLLWLERAGRKA